MNRNSFHSSGVNLSQVNMNTQNINNLTRAITKLRNEISTSFIKLSDTPSFFGAAGQVVAVNSTRTGLVFVNQTTGGGGVGAPGATSLAGLSDTSVSNNADNQLLQYNVTTQIWENVTDLELPGTLTCPNAATFNTATFNTIDINSSTSSSINVFRSTKDTNNNCKVNINANDGSEALVLTGVHPTTGSTGSNHKTIESKQGLIYLTNSLGGTNGINNDNVGVVKIAHTHTSSTLLGTDYLQISSDFQNQDYTNYGAGASIPNLINLVNKERGYNYSHMNVDVGGITTFRANELVDQFTIYNTYQGGNPQFNYNGTIMHVRSRNPNAVGPYKYDFETGVDTINPNGYTFVKYSGLKSGSQATTVSISGGGGTGAGAIAYVSHVGTVEKIVILTGGSGYNSIPVVNISGSGSAAAAIATVSGGAVTNITLTSGGSGYDQGEPDTKCQIDGDGSIKCRESVSIIGTTSGSLTWPTTGNNTYNLTLIAEKNHSGGDNRGAWISSEYSNDDAGCPLYLKAFGTNITQTGTKRAKNMVNIVENEIITDSSNNDYSEIHFCLRNKSTVDYFDNYLWLNNRTELEANDGYYITSYKQLTGNRKFGIRKTGIMYNDPSDFNSTTIDSHIIRHDPNKYTGHLTSMGADGAYLTLGDDRKQIVRIGSGTQRYTSGTTFNLNPSANPNITGSILDVQTIFGDNVLCRYIGSGNANSTLEIGNTVNTKNVVIEMGHATAQSSINLGDEGCITCASASNFTSGSTGPTNICNANHNGFIGTYSINPLSGTGIRANSVNANFTSTVTLASTVKLYTAKMPQDLGYDNNEYFHPTCLESPQGLIVYRGQVEVLAQTCTLSLDSVLPDTNCNVIVPHTMPKTLKSGTFQSLFKNVTVQVTNAGIRDPVQTDTLAYQPDFTQVFGMVRKDGVAPTEDSILQITCNIAPPSGMCVNYVIYAERSDQGYNSLGTFGNAGAGGALVQSYNNQFLGGTVTTYNGVSTKQQFQDAFGVDLENPAN